MPSQIQKILRYINKAYKFAIWKTKDVLLWDYYYDSLREPKLKSAIPHDPLIQIGIIEELKRNGLNVIDLEINLSDYKQYIKYAEYYNFPRYLRARKSSIFAEKSLEHYLSAKLLNISKEDVYIDIANANSPTPEIFNKLYGCQVYRQDLSFPEGIQGNIIGGDAGNIPVKKGFATKMALHCSFEHFENDSDIRFIKEASRILKKGGRLCIIPLYLFTEYAIQTDPSVLPKGGISFESDAILYCTRSWRNRQAVFTIFLILFQE